MSNSITMSMFNSPQIASTDEYKTHHASLWSKRADKYAAQAHEGAGVLIPLVQHIAGIATGHLQSIDPSQALDIASGSGEPALSIAKALPQCQVVATDLAPGMVEQAKRRAEAQGITNLRADVADAEDLSAFGDAIFDAVTCCAGMMLLRDHHKALREWHRVMKPGALLAVAVWGPAGERTQMINIMRGLAEKLATGVQHKGNPNQLGDAEQLAKDVAAAGFSKVETSEFNVPMEVPADHVHEAMLENPMIGDFLDQARDKGRQNIIEEALVAVREVAAERGLLQDDGGLTCPTNIAIIVTATA